MRSSILYVATNTETGAEKLVEAYNQAGVRNHVARQLIKVRVAKATEAARMVKEGIEVEIAGEDAELCGA